ncbi:MAG: hypothetical protein EB134_05705, partial [Actinobacteria bacterium]|nr:hypothetical protein [Actinomycetota bacterium]
MSFETLKIAELKKIAEDFGVEIDGLKNKTDIIAALSEEGVTWSVYEKTLEKSEEEDDMATEVLAKPVNKKVNPEDTLLVKMERHNYSYETHGFTFTKEHPFVAMDKDTAQDIFD